MRIPEKNSQLLATMSRWAGIENNIFFVFRKTLESRPPEPYRTMLERFVARVEGGMEADKALRQDLHLVKSPFMHHVFMNILSVIEHNGDLKILLGKFEYESFKVEEALWDNQIRLYKDRLLLHLLNLMVLVSCVRLVYLDHFTRVFAMATGLACGTAAVVATLVGRPRY